MAKGNDSSVDFALQLRIENEKAVEQMRAIRDEIKKIFSEAVSLKISADPDFKNAVRKVQGLEGNLSDLETRASSTSQALTNIDKEAREAATAVERHFKGASESIRKAFSEGGVTTALREVDRLAGKLKSGGGVDSKALQDVAKTIRQINKDGGSGQNEQAKKAQEVGKAWKNAHKELDAVSKKLDEIERDMTRIDEGKRKTVQRVVGGVKKNLGFTDLFELYDEAEKSQEQVKEKLGRLTEELYQHGQELGEDFIRAIREGKEIGAKAASTGTDRTVESVIEDEIAKLAGKGGTLSRVQERIAKANEKGNSTAADRYERVRERVEGRLKALRTALEASEKGAEHAAKTLEDLAARSAQHKGTDDFRGRGRQLVGALEQSVNIARTERPDFTSLGDVTEGVRRVRTEVDEDELLEQIRRAIDARKFELSIDQEKLHAEVQEALNRGDGFELRLDQGYLLQQFTTLAQALPALDLNVKSVDISPGALSDDIKRMESEWTNSLQNMAQMRVKASMSQWNRIQAEAMKSSGIDMSKIGTDPKMKSQFDKFAKRFRDQNPDRTLPLTDVINDSLSQGGKLKIPVHLTHIRKQIGEAIRNAEKLRKTAGTARIGVNQPYLLTDLGRIIEEANKTSAQHRLILPIHATKLREQIRDVARNEDALRKAGATLRLGVNQPYFISSLVAAIEAAERLELDVNVNATMNALQQASQAAAKEAREAAGEAVEAARILDDRGTRLRANAIRRDEKRQERRRERLGQASKDNARLAGHDATRAIQFLKQHAPHMVSPAQKIVAAHRPGADPEVRTQAKDLLLSFQRDLNDFQRSTASDISKELVKRFKEGFRSEFITDFDKKIRKADAQLSSNLIEQSYDQFVGQFSDSIRAFTGMQSDYATPRDHWKEQQTAYQRYVRTVQDYERKMLEWAKSRNLEEAETASKKVDGARKALDLAADELRLRSLASLDETMTVGQIRARPWGNTIDRSPGSLRTVPVEEGFSLLRGFFERELGGVLQQMRSRNDDRRNTLLASGRHQEAYGIQDLKIDDMISGLAKGNREIENLYLRTKGYSEDVLQNDVKRQQVLRNILGPLDESLRDYTRINGVLKEQIQLQQLSQRYQRYQAARNQAVSPYRNATRAIGYQLGGYAIGMAVAFQLREAFQTYVELEDEIKGIQAVLSSKSEFDAARIMEGIASTSAAYGADILETAKAARILAQTGMEADEVIQELNYTMMAMRGMDMTIEQMQELQIAVRAVVGEAEAAGATISVLEKIARVESSYAVTAKDLADALKISSPVINQYSDDIAGMGDAFDYTLALTTAMVEQLRITGNQAGNALKFILARIPRPQVLNSLEQDFGLRLFREGGTELLALPDILGEVANKYRELQEAGQGAKAQQLAVTLAGGRQVNTLISVLDQYDKVTEVARTSTEAFGDAQERADIKMESLSARLGVLNTNFNLFTKNMMENSGAAHMFADGIGAISAVMGGVSGQGGGFGALTALALGGSAIAGGGKLAFGKIGLAMDAAAMGTSMKRMDQIRKNLKFGQFAQGTAKNAGLMTRALGTLGRVLTPTGALITGGLALAGATGAVYKAFKDASDEAEQYQIQLKSLADLEIWNSPQMQNYQDIALRTGFGNASEAYQATVDAILGGDSETSIGQLLQSRGASDFQELLQFAKDGQVEWEGLRKEIAGAFIEDLGEGASALREIEDEETRVAEAITLIGQAAWAANLEMSRSIEALRNSTQAMIDDTLAGLDSLDMRNRDNIWQRTLGGISDFFSGRELLQTPISPGLRQVSRAEVNEQGVPIRRAVELDSSDIRANEVLRTIGKELPNRIYRALSDQSTGFSSILQSVLDEAAVGRETLSYAEVFRRTVNQIEDLDARGITTGRRVARISSGNTVQTQDATAQDLIEERLRDAYLRGQGLTQLANRLREATGQEVFIQGQEDPFDRFESWLTARLSAAQASAIESLRQAGKNDVADSLAATRDVAENARSARRVRQVADGTAEALLDFKNSLLDVVLSFRQELLRSDVEKSFANQFGLAFNEAENRMQALRTLYTNASMFSLNMEDQVIKLQNELNSLGVDDPVLNIQVGATEGEGDDILSGLGARRDDIEREIKAIQQGLLEFASGALGIRDLVDANSSEGSGLISWLDSVEAAVEGGKFTTLQELFTEMPKEAYDKYRELAHEQNRQLQVLEAQEKVAEKLADLRKQSLEFETDVTQKTLAREAIERRLLDNQIAILQAKVDIGDKDLDEARLDAERLTQELLINQVHQRRVDLLNSQLELNERAKSTLQGMLSGFDQTLRDMPSLWGPILNAEGVEERAEAVRAAVLRIFEPLGQTLHERVVDNLMENVAEALYANGSIREILESPETRLRDQIQQQTELVVTASEIGASFYYNAIIEASQAGARIRAGGVPEGMDLTRKTPRSLPSATNSQASLRAIGTQLLQVAGSQTGTILGGGTQGASTGANLGGLVGALAGSLIPGAGTAVGGFAGSAIGGFLGGKLFGDVENETQVSALQAIERAQRETIQAITQQTDALLSPENTILNAPTNFAVPNYRPGGAGGGGGQSVVVEGGINPQIVIQGNADKGTVEQIRSVAVEAVEEALYGGQKRGSRKATRG